MAGGFVQVAPDSTGKIVDTSELTRADTKVVERQRINITSDTVETNILTIAPIGSSDGEAGTDIALAAESYLKAFNGTGWDRLRMFSMGGLQIAPQPAPANTAGAIVAATTAVGPVTMGQWDGITITVSGTHAGVNFGCWGSLDNTLWFPVNGVRTDSSVVETTSGVLTSNSTRAWDIDIGEALYFKVLATAWTSGSAAIVITTGMFATAPSIGAVAQGPAAAAAAISGNPVRIGGTFTTALPTYTTGQQTDLQTTAKGEVLAAISSGGTAVAVKAASTAAAATDPAMVVALSPNSPIKLPTPSTSVINSAATTNATSIKASAGAVLSVTASNTGAAVAYVKLYNLATAPTVGTSAIAITISVPAGGTVNLPFGTAGAQFSAGIGLAITNLGTDADTTAVVAAQVKVITAYI